MNCTLSGFIFGRNNVKNINKPVRHWEMCIRDRVMYPDIPANDDEIIARIGDADAVLLSYTSRINRYVLECCPNVKYRCV